MSQNPIPQWAPAEYFAESFPKQPRSEWPFRTNYFYCPKTGLSHPQGEILSSLTQCTSLKPDGSHSRVDQTQDLVHHCSQPTAPLWIHPWWDTPSLMAFRSTPWPLRTVAHIPRKNGRRTGKEGKTTPGLAVGLTGMWRKRGWQILFSSSRSEKPARRCVVSPLVTEQEETGLKKSFSWKETEGN